MSKTFNYPAIEIKQTPNSKPFYMFSCKAVDILEWADVPKTKKEIMAGYQRELDDRHEKITEFFTEDDENNIIPNAIIIALNSGTYNFSPASSSNSKIHNLEIQYNKISEEDSIKRLREKLESRLSESELSSISVENDEDDLISTVEQDEDAEDSDDAVPPESYLAMITKVVRQAESDKSSLKNTVYESIVAFAKSMDKPGLILDGQHRVYGAKNVNDFDVELPVIILPGISHQEQVFHFYVLNNKAVPLKPTKLRTIISTSLGKNEIEKLYDRFKQAGVTAEQAEWSYKMANNSNSPFKGIVDINQGYGVIKENVAYQLVSKFMKMNRKYHLLWKDIPEWDGDDKWDFRIERFFAFWSAIKDKYNSAWNEAITPNSKNKQILQKVCLLTLMEFVLNVLNTERPKQIARGIDSPFKDCEKLKEEVELTLDFIKEEFFTKEWKKKGLDTSRGHKLFSDALQTALDNQSRNLGNMTIFKEGNV